MDTKRSITACVAEIRALNSVFRRRPNMPEAEADPLRERKDRLIDEMAGLCSHPLVIGASVVRRMGMPDRAIRICDRCGFCETHEVPGRFQTLAKKRASRQVIILPIDDYLIRQGLILKKLGINL